MKANGNLRVQALLLGLLGWLAISAFGASCLAEPANTAGNEFFEKHVRPLLVERCQACHGPKKQWAGLRLDSALSLHKGGDSGPAVVAGKTAESELYLRVTAQDAEVRMPPEEAGPALTAEQVQLLGTWIEMGAPWPDTGQGIADATREAQRRHWAFQPIVRAREPEVRNTTWPRNAIDRFILAKLEAEAVRPAEEADRRALIRRVTYDLTGLPPTSAEVIAFVDDQSPNAYEKLIDRLLASPHYGEHWGRHWLDVARYSDTKGYVYGREERKFVHSGLYRDWVVQAFNSDLPYNRFVLLQLAADQAAADDPSTWPAMGFLTLGRRFLGVTHDIIDDRIDVVSRGLLGLTVGCARCHDHKYDPIPTADYYSLYGVFNNCTEQMVPVPRSATAAPPSAEVERELTARKQRLAEATTAKRAQAGERIRQRIDRYLLAQTELDKYPALLFNQLLPPEDLVPTIVHGWSTYLYHARQVQDPIFVPWFAYVELPHKDFADAAVQVTKRLQAAADTIHPRILAQFAQPPATLAEVAQRYQQLFAQVDAQWQTALKTAQAGGQPAPTALQDPHDEALRQVMYGVRSPCVIPDEPIVSTEPLWDYQTILDLWKVQTDVDQWILKSPDAAPHAVVLNDRPHPVDPRIFRRGNPTMPGEIVLLQNLEILAGPGRQPFKRGSGRYELAQAIVDPENPLTSRVWVNRVWMHHFGQGLVTTPSDFGLRSNPPSHPELLDWLASEFMANRWSTKWLHRQIMLSATYRQSSTSTAEAAVAARDPDNRWLWRMNPRRLSVEQFRDTLIALSGEMDPAIGGTSVELFAPGSTSMRRSIYGFVDRQFVPSVLRVFDFANPDLHTGARAETIVPQQALFALNSPFVAGRASAVVKQLAIAGNGDSPELVEQLYQRVLQRAPTPAEMRRAMVYLKSGMVPPATRDTAPVAGAWSYGYGEMDTASGHLRSFAPLPYFAGHAWQGGASWPDATLGWLQITATGGHPGNDSRHAVVRRWTAPRAGSVSVTSEMIHEPQVGDGVRYWVISNRHGVLKSGAVHAAKEPVNFEAIEVQAGDTLDFVVDVNATLNSDQHLWSPELRMAAEATDKAPESLEVWNAARDFTQGPAVPVATLGLWDQLTQALLISNETMFVD